MREIRYTPLTIGDADSRELSLRLKMPAGESPSNIDKYIEEVRRAVDCKACAIEVEVAIDDGVVRLGDIEVKSENFAKNLSGCKAAYVMAVTLGAGVDMLLRRKSVISAAEHFICDAVASALAEKAADTAEEYFVCGEGCRPRFSPGYGDLPLDIQGDVLEMCGARKLLGISLTDTLLMVPTKSVTAIIGKCD